MKAFAIFYRAIDEGRVDFQFSSSPSPQFRYASRDLAANDCLRLNRAECHVGDHRCSFVVDDLPEGDFGIICASHPFDLWR